MNGRVLFLLVGLAGIAAGYLIVTPLQRVLILEAIEDVRLFALEDSHWEKPIGVLPAGTRTVIAYCEDTKSNITPVVAFRANEKAFAQAGKGKLRIQPEKTGLFSWPRVLRCGDY